MGAVGSGVSITARIMAEALQREYAYDVRIIKASDQIKENAHLVGKEVPNDLQGSGRIEFLQDIGNEIRKDYGGNYVIEKCIQLIGIERLESGGYDEVGETEKLLVAKSRRHATIIDSVKHPDEVKLLRDVYGDLFWLFTVFSPEKTRRNRLKKTGFQDPDISKIMTRDENESVDHGQKVRDTSHLGDFFIRNDGENDESLRQIIGRYLDIVFGIPVQSPNKHEAAMYNVISSSSKSACMSRQVGAAIYSQEGKLLGVGWNDVPKSHGGFYSTDDGVNDNRCFKWGGKICHNDDRKNKLYISISEKLNEEKFISPTVNDDQIIDSLKKTDIKGLI